MIRTEHESIYAEISQVEDYDFSTSERRIEFDNANRRWRNRMLYLSISSSIFEDRFIYDIDSMEDEDVSYITDTQPPLDFDSESVVGVDERETHKRIVFFDKNGYVSAIEFFDSAKEVDLRELELEDEVITTLAENGVSVILNPENPNKT